MAELQSAVRQKVQMHLESGNDAFGRGDYFQAAVEYREAWQIIPMPRSDYDEITVLVGVALGEAYFFHGDIQFANDIWAYLLHCPSGATNPYVHMRYGQARYELRDADGAFEYFMFAYLAGGMDMLRDELRNGEHLSFIKQELHLDKPPNDINIVGDWEYEENVFGMSTTDRNRFSANTKVVIFSISYSHGVSDRLFFWLNRCAGGVLVHGAILLYGIPPAVDNERVALLEGEIRWLLGTMMSEEVASILPFIHENDPQLSNHIERVLGHQEINAILGRPDRERWDEYVSTFPQ